VGWILSAMDALDYPRPRPPIGIIPLGTGNDLSRSLGWGGKYRDKPLRKVLSDISRADVVDMDRWNLGVSATPQYGGELTVGILIDVNEPLWLSISPGDRSPPLVVDSIVSFAPSSSHSVAAERAQ